MELQNVDGMYRDMASKIGNRVRCEKCGKETEVDSAECLRTGWPECHGYTMTLLPRHAQ